MHRMTILTATFQIYPTTTISQPHKLLPAVGQLQIVVVPTLLQTVGDMAAAAIAS